jgi:transposase
VESPRRERVTAMVSVLSRACPWRDVPHDVPRWCPVAASFQQGKRDGTWERVPQALRRDRRGAGGKEPEPRAAHVRETVPTPRATVLTRAQRAHARLNWDQRRARMLTSRPPHHSRSRSMVSRLRVLSLSVSLWPPPRACGTLRDSSRLGSALLDDVSFLILISASLSSRFPFAEPSFVGISGIFFLSACFHLIAHHVSLSDPSNRFIKLAKP